MSTLAEINAALSSWLTRATRAFQKYRTSDKVKKKKTSSLISKIKNIFDSNSSPEPAHPLRLWQLLSSPLQQDPLLPQTCA